MKILYAGYLGYGSTSHSRMIALKELNHEIIELDYWTYLNSTKYLLGKIQNRLLIGKGIATLNDELIKIDAEIKPDIVWIDKGIFIKPAVVKLLKERNRFIVQHNTDDIKFKKQGFNKFFIPSIPYSDVHLTSNTFNLNEFKEFGAKNVIHMELAYNHHLHKPVDLKPEEIDKYKADVSFIGHWEPSYEKFIVELRKRGINVRLMGTGWKNAYDKELRNDNISGVYGDEYVKALCAAKINLCFVSVWNRNVVTARSFEIPACKTFMLAIRTDAHMRYYKEGKEAEFFSHPDELSKKIKYYLAHDEERKLIAYAGYKRCISSDYSELARMKEVMKQILNIFNKKNYHESFSKNTSNT